jgi:hypothetical protein
MADRSNYQQGIVKRYYEHFDTISLQRLSEIVSDIYMSDANKPVKLWDKARTLLSRVAGEDERVAKIIAKKDIEGLARLVNELSLGMKAKPTPLAPGSAGGHAASASPTAPQGTPAPSSASSTPTVPASPANDPLSPDNLKRAMKAFRKRMKLTRLDDESKLGRMGNAMSGGKQSQVDAIMAPREFSKSVWDELVKQGKLRTTDGVFYSVIEGT